MLNIRNEEKNLKRYLNEKIILKILIIGTLAFTLTACGGGGSSQGTTVEEHIKTEVIDKKNEGHRIIGKNVKIEGQIIGDSSAINLVGITVENSNIENYATINLTSEGAIGIKGTTDGKKAIYTIKNNGKISLSGKNSIGMYAENGVIIENNGVITGTGEGNHQQKEDGTIIEESFGTIGIKVTNGSKGVNNKNIIMNGAYARGMYADKNSTIENNGKISLTSKIVNETELDENCYYEGYVYSTEKGMRAKSNSIAINNGIIVGNGQIIGVDVREKSQGINNGNIELKSLSQDEKRTIDSGDYYKIIQKEVLSKIRGMRGRDEGTVITNNKNIKLIGNAIGMDIDKQASGINNGNIILNSLEIKTDGYAKGDLEDGTFDWKYLEKGNTFSNLVGMFARDNSEIANSQTGNILLTGTGIGMEAFKNSIAKNNGTIRVEAGKEIWGPTISLTSKEKPIDYYKWASVIGMSANDSKIINNEAINVLNSGIGMKAFKNSIAENNGTIRVEAGKNPLTSQEIPIDYKWASVIGMGANESKIINNGTINVLNAGIGMEAFENSIAENNGTININGEGTIGMYAGVNSTAINTEKGIINVSSLAKAGMVADGENAKIINNGTINLAERDGLTSETKESIALQAINGGTIENNGTINIAGDLKLITRENSSYVIGTTKDGEYGKISANTAKLDGNIIISTEITKGEFKNKYTLENIVDAENITLEDKFEFNSNSLLYDATAKTDSWGNLDATLIRNDKTLVDYSTDETKENAKIFGKYYTEEFYKGLSSDAKTIISTIDTSSKENLNKHLRELKPTLYSNISRQILDTSKFFKEQEKEVINTLGENKYNFKVIGDYKDVASKGLIEGYISKTNGFIGIINLGIDTFGTIGYSYNDIDYKDSSNENIQTIHLGLNKILNFNKFNINLGLNGQYNLNEYKREIEFLNRNAKSNFNSYTVGFTSEISRTFGKENYLKPYLGLDITYLKYEAFNEKNANSLNVAMDSQDYVSILPKVGINIENTLNTLRTFVNIEYSYELGNMNKCQTYAFEGFEGKAKLENDNLEHILITTKMGTSYKVNTLTLTGAIGKEFGKRDNIFASISLGYKF